MTTLNFGTSAAIGNGLSSSLSANFPLSTQAMGIASNALSAPTTQIGAGETASSLAVQANAADPIAAGNALRQLDRITGTPVQTNQIVAQAKAETCNIEIGYKPVAAGASHTYVHTQDASGDSYFRGGPSGGGPGSGSSGQLGSGSSGSASQSSNSNSNSSGSDSGNSSSPGSSRGGPDRNNGTWGAIRADSGADARRIETKDPDSSPRQRVAEVPGNCDAIDATLAGTTQRINEAQIPYNPFSTNSNATSRTLLESIGVNGVSPNQWSPGWDTQLPISR
jgi:hypothetical protein